MEIRCLIVDDDETARHGLAQFCEKIEGLSVLAACASAEEALTWLRDDWADLLLLDVELPGLSGLELLERLDRVPYVIFLAEEARHAAAAFHYREQVIDFFTKPISFAAVAKAIEHVRERLLAEQQRETLAHIFVKSDGKIVRIHIDELVYIETVGDYVMFRTLSGQHMVHASMKSVDERLRHGLLARVHRSYMVNITKIVDIEGNNILMEGRKVVPLSRQYRPLLLRRLDPI